MTKLRASRNQAHPHQQRYPERRLTTLARCCRGVTATSATSHGIGCTKEYCKKRRIERIGLLDPASASPFPVHPRGLPAVSVCRTLSYSAHPLGRFAFPSESTNQRRPGTHVRAPSLGFLPSSRHRPVESTHASFPSSLRSAHDVSHVLDGLLLHQPLRVCFTPQPRPGFALQGLPLAPSRAGSSPAVALVSLPAFPAVQFPNRLQVDTLAFRALLRVRVRGSTQRFRPRPARSPLELFLPRVFLLAPCKRPSSPAPTMALLWPSSYHQRAT
jgi:hypothetical protein